MTTRLFGPAMSEELLVHMRQVYPRARTVRSSINDQ